MTTSTLLHPRSIFWTKESYEHVSTQFHPYHQHDMNVAAHFVTTGLAVWAAIQWAVHMETGYAVYAYAALIAFTTPLTTALLHTLYVAACLQVAMPSVVVTDDWTVAPEQLCIVTLILGFLAQDLSHIIFCEETYMSSYMSTANYWMLLVHTLWLMPLVIDSVWQRACFLPTLLVSRNRNVWTKVASRAAVSTLRDWVNQHVPATPETTHVWPHENALTSAACTALEDDTAILAAFRRVFAEKHYSVRPVKGMNEIYVTAVGAKKEINSDAVFYTPHVDGPFWWTPYASLYRVLVGMTPNRVVQTKFNLQHESCDQVVDLYGVLGFDYNRELHWIDHVPDTVNDERRSVLKLHFVVYPTGWHWYGNLVAYLNTRYNTWARGNFLKTLRPDSVYEIVLAWVIWLTTWVHAACMMHVGFENILYMLIAYLAGPLPFLILTSFRHYAVYICTFASREPPVAHGYLVRDALLYKTVSMMHLAWRLLPLLQWPTDVPMILTSLLGFGTTMLATYRLGKVRTYFGSELGFVKPQWIDGFPYGTIPHPMIVGQVFAFGVILVGLYDRLTPDNIVLLTAHMMCYITHMVQEMFTSSY